MITVMIDGGSTCPSQIQLTQVSQPGPRTGSLQIGQLVSAELGGEMLPAGAPAPSFAAAQPQNGDARASKNGAKARLIGEA